MTAIATPPAHRVTGAVADMHAVLDQVTDASLWSMDALATTTTLTELQRLTNRVVELQARVLAHADQTKVGDESGATSTPNWYAHHTKLTRREAHRQTRLATALEAHEQTRAALAEGRLHVEQAEIITRALDDLPDDLDPDLVARAEAHLIGEAAHHDAKTLRILGRRLLEVIDPDAADAHQAKLLEREEHQAAAAAPADRLGGRPRQDSTAGSALTPGCTGAMLKKALFALAAPRHRAASGPLGDRKPTPERLGLAFVELIQRYPTKRLPKAGGLNATVVVHLDPRLPDGRPEGSPARHRRAASPPHSPVGWLVRPGSSPPSSTAGPRSSTWAARSGSTTKASGSSKTIEAGGCERRRLRLPHRA